MILTMQSRTLLEKIWHKYKVFLPFEHNLYVNRSAYLRRFRFDWWFDVWLAGRRFLLRHPPPPGSGWGWPSRGTAWRLLRRRPADRRTADAGPWPSQLKVITKCSFISVISWAPSSFAQHIFPNAQIQLEHKNKMFDRRRNHLCTSSCLLSWQGASFKTNQNESLW